MESALSLKSGDYIDAVKANYETSKKMLLVCPECGEPVHFKLREIPYRTAFFAHPKEQVSIKLMKACSLRVDGSEFKTAFSVVPGIAHGQLVNKFQREFCKEMHDSIGSISISLVNFISHSGFLNLEKEAYRNLIEAIERLTPDSDIFIAGLDNSEERILKEGVEDVCRFLRSPYGIWVGNYIYQAAYFVACMVHPDTVNRSLGTTLNTVKKTKSLFVVEAYRLKDWEDFAASTMKESDKRNIAIFQISASLVSYLLHKWRFKERIPQLIQVADAKFEKEIAEKKYQNTFISPKKDRYVKVENMQKSPEIWYASFTNMLPAKQFVFRKESSLPGASVAPSWLEHQPLINIGATSGETDAKDVPLEVKIRTRIASYFQSDFKYLPNKWAYLSDIGVVINLNKFVYVDRTSFRMSNGNFCISSDTGLQLIPYKLVTWK